MYKVSVGLEAEMAQFIGPMEAAVAITEKMDRSVDGLDRSINKLPADSARAAAAMKLLSGDVGTVKSSIDELGKGSGAMGLLDQRIRNTRNEIKRLTTDFEKGGDLSVFRELGKAHGDLGALTRIRKDLTNAIEGGSRDGAKTFAQLFQGGVINAFKDPRVLAAAGVLALAVGPVIGSAIGGAIIAAGALGAIALGVAGAAQVSPEQVGAAWHNQIRQIKDEWLDASVGFVKPTIEAIHTLGGAVRDIHISEILQKAATFVAPLAQGVAGFVTGITRGVQALVDNAGPVIEMLKSELPKLGDAVGMSLSMIAGGSGGAAKGLADILQFSGKLIVAVGVAIRLTEDLYTAFISIGDAIRTITDKIPFSNLMAEFLDPKQPKAFAVSLDGAAHGLDKTKDAAAGAAENLDHLNSTLHKTTVTTDSLAAAMVGKLFAATMGLQQANISFAESLLNIKDAADRNGKSLTANTHKAYDNQKAILASVSANMELYQAQISAGMSAEQAAANYDTNFEATMRAAKAAGFSKSQVAALTAQYKGVPKNVNTAIAMQGLTNAINGLADLIREINGIDRNITVTTHFRQDGSPSNLRGQSRAGGQGIGAQGAIRMDQGAAIVAPSNPGTFLFAEPQTGGEAFIPLRGIAQSRAMGLAQVVGNNYGFDVYSRPSDRGRGPAYSMPPMQRFEELFIWMWLRLDQQGAFAGRR